MTNRSNEPVIWRLTDGKAGHDSQSNGLCLALQEKYSCRIAVLNCPSLIHLFGGKWQNLENIQAPDLIIGAGHKTHLPMLWARRCTGAACVVIMKPSLPPGWFDLCLVPDHDAVTPADNIVTTRGAINAIKPSNVLVPDQGLMMIGGPSKRHGWDNGQLLNMIETVINKSGSIRWCITNSPRTPDATATALSKLTHDRLEYISYQQTDRAWLVDRLTTSGSRWVTEDSVSMIYEALTACGNSLVFPVPRKREDKVTRSLDKLYEDSYLGKFDTWLQAPHSLKRISLNEAARCAELVFQRLLASKGFSSP